MRKIIAIIIPLIMIVSCVNPCFANGEASGKATEYQKAVDLMKKLDIGISVEEGYVTREDFAILISQITGIYGVADGIEECVFDDVNNSVSGLMNALCEVGYFTIPDTKKFRPDDFITSEEAAAVCVRVLGYEGALGEKRQMSDYVRYAAKLDLLDGVSVVDFRNEDVNMLLFNTLNTKCIPYIINGRADKRDAKETLMEQVFGVVRIEDKINSIRGISIVAQESGNDESIIVGNIECYSEDVLSYSLLGSKVEAYIYKDDSKNVLLAYYPMIETEKEVFELSGVDAQKDLSHITYETTEGRIKKYYLEKSITVVYNNEKLFSVSEKHFEGDAGSVFLADTDRNGKYDLAIIEKYDYYTVAFLDKSEEVILDEGNKPALYLETANENAKHRIYNPDGNKMKFEKLVIGDMLEVLYTADKNGQIDFKKSIEIRVIRSNFIGKVDAKGSNRIYIGDKEYTCTQEMFDELVVGRTYSFKLGTAGNIIYAKENIPAGEAVYGYLVKAAMKKGISSTVQVKIFTLSETMEIYDTDEKVYYCGEMDGKYFSNKKIDGNEFLTLFKEAQLVKYSLDENGKLKKIYKATDNSLLSPEDYAGYDDTRFTKEYETETGRIYNSLASENYWYNSSSRVFIIPNDGKEEHYSVGGYGQLGTDVTNLNISLYDSDASFYVSAAVVKTAVSESSNVTMSVETLGDANLAIIESKIYVRDAEDEFRTSYKAYHKGKEITLIAKNFEKLSDTMVSVDIQGEKDTIKFSELNPGDLIMFHLNDKGEVNGFEVLFRCNYLDDSPKEINMQQGVGYVSVFQTYAGRATTYVPGRYFVLENSPTRMFNLTGSADSRNVYEFDIDTKKVRVLESVGAIESTDYLFVKTRRTTVRDVVVYKNYK